MSAGRHLVVVDDDRDIRNLIVAFFKPQGYVMTCFEDAESALEQLPKHGNQWDVVLCDLKLPRISGLDLATQVKKRLPHAQVILITTSRSADSALEAIRKGACDFIVKPIHFPQLQISVERALKVKDMDQSLRELRERVRRSPSASAMIGKSPKFLESLDVARRVAKSKASIFISGESGTGKEVFAKFIHSESAMSKGPFVAINCSAIPENLLESELFGYAKGAFTGAGERKIGLFEEAQNGTLFLDEIGDLSAPLQAKLLRVLQERKIKRLGENQFRPINCRIVSATHKNLLKEIRESRFREDLFFRLNVIPISIPPLRERPEDILPLAESFLRRFAAENDSPARYFSKESVRFLLENKWMGNVRELENSVERAVVLSSSDEIPVENLMPLFVDPESPPRTESPADLGTVPAGDGPLFTVNCSSRLPSLEEVMNRYVGYAVTRNGGARDRTAREIGIDRRTLYKRLRSDAEPNP